MNYKDYCTHLNEAKDTQEIYIKILTARAKSRFPDADFNDVYIYCMSNSNGITIKQFEDDAKAKKMEY
jgi:hypothetical protein